MKWRGKQVLVTGAGGFIGSHLTERLVKEGAKTRAFVHYRSNGSWGWLDHSRLKEEIEVIAGDIRDPDSVLSAVHGTELVFHLAALIAIPYSYQAPLSYVRTNVEGTLNVLQAVGKEGTQRLIHTSTSETYGTTSTVPIHENYPQQAQSPYAASKVGADQLAESFYHSFDLPVVILRPFNTYGPRQSQRAVIPTIITQCLQGSMVRLGNINPTRDFNYVDDTVEGFLCAAEASDAAVGRTINIGFGREISIEELVKTIGGLMNKNITIETQEERMRPDGSEVERLRADHTLARELLKWSPTVLLEDGLQKTIEWMGSHLSQYRGDQYVI
jgi:NAD dependent epimerase/dehydratase